MNSGFVKKDVLSILACVGSGVVCGAYYSKHTFLLQNYKNYIELQRDGKHIEPSERLKTMINDVSEDLKDSISKFTPIVPFVIPGLHTWHAGTIGTSHGGIVGLPAFFEYCSKEDVNGKFLVKSKNLLHSDKLEEETYECLLLSDRAKKYAIAKEILHINTIQVQLDSILPIAIAFGMEYISTRLGVLFEVNKYPLFFRGLFSTVAVLFALAIWRLLHSNLRNYYESEIQFELTKLGEDYIEGGIEYLTKEMRRESISVELKDQSQSMLQVVDETLNSFIPSKTFSSSKILDYLNYHLETQKNLTIK